MVNKLLPGIESDDIGGLNVRRNHDAGVEFRSLRATMSQNSSVPQALAQRELRKTLEEVLEALGPS